MILWKLPHLRMTFLYSYYEIWKITSNPEGYLENNHLPEWQYSIHLVIFEKKPEWYLENNLPSEWQFPIHLTIFQI